MVSAVEDALKRLIAPSVKNEIRVELTDRAQESAIDVFSDNLGRLLMQPPVKGKIVMGVGCGLLVFVIRRFSSMPEGVSYAILIMNLTVPLLDRYLNPRVYGEVRKRA